MNGFRNWIEDYVDYYKPEKLNYYYADMENAFNEGVKSNITVKAIRFGANIIRISDIKNAEFKIPKKNVRNTSIRIFTYDGKTYIKHYSDIKDMMKEFNGIVKCINGIGSSYLF